MSCGAGEPTAKRAKVDEAKEEEDPLVRRREELVLMDANARAKGKELGERMVREAEEKAKQLKREANREASSCEESKRKRLRRNAKKKGKRLVREAKKRAVLESDWTLSEARLSFGQELRSVCAALEDKNEKLLGRLPPELWQIINKNLHQNDLLALAMTSRFFRDTTKGLGRKLETDWTSDRLLKLRKSGKMPSHSLGWFLWVCDTFEILPGFEKRWERVKGAVYEGNLVNYAAFQGSVEILRWLIEEKGCKLNKNTGWYAGLSGSVEVLGYLKLRAYEFTSYACQGAARGGCLEALKFLRGLDPPCPWGEVTCAAAAEEGHLDVLKWARSQDPPCPWDEETCWGAAYRGHLEVLKFLRAQDPPCPWNRRECKGEASRFCYWHIVDWIDQQEDESDVELSDSDDDRSYDSYGDDYF
ncbi:hypothetical protein HKI87_12g71300 [Chloropicon roscoffensis]|uniref:F-box domain-containing protein n=1 Tax=Chloropicon roscoffensis TaxID=1461544 RepID=A0AAX4PIZ5_9CHLO